MNHKNKKFGGLRFGIFSKTPLYLKMIKGNDVIEISVISRQKFMITVHETINGEFMNLKSFGESAFSEHLI